MAHRGRLNVLVNVLGKSPGTAVLGVRGQVRRQPHAGLRRRQVSQGLLGRCAHRRAATCTSRWPSIPRTWRSSIRWSKGSVRARQERRDDAHGDKVVPVLMHGDAAFAGQGVVMETLQLSQARGYRTGGTLTSSSTIRSVSPPPIRAMRARPLTAATSPRCSRRRSCTSMRTIPKPWCSCTRLALRYRQRFHKDFVIDLVCYRRLGHNEADEPAATQPVMYRAIRQHPTCAQALRRPAGSQRACSARPTPSSMVEQYRKRLDSGRLEHAPGAGSDRQQVHRRLVALSRKSIGPSGRVPAVSTGAPRRLWAKRLSQLPRRL